ncbi:MAG: conjugal transfer protein [Oscillospiraceae bacterium]|nr:conjugal transfer protein [Oscillospiraceae bacterium]
MCTRFVCNAQDTITGFNFDIDLSVWDHTILKEKDRFCIGIKRPDGLYHGYHGVHACGNVGTLLYVHGNAAGMHPCRADCCTVAELTEAFIKNELSFDEALRTVQEKKIVYAVDATMQSMLSDKTGRVLIIEPGIGWRAERNRCSLITNYSLLQPESTRPYIVPGDDRFERAQQLLREVQGDFTTADAFSVLRGTLQRGLWATRVSFVYSVKERCVYYARSGDLEQVETHAFS